MQGNGSCELGKYFLGNDFVQVLFANKKNYYWQLPFLFKAYNPGNFSTFFKLRRSDDNCFVKYPGQANTEMVEEFCSRMGGRVPGIRGKLYFRAKASNIVLLCRLEAGRRTRKNFVGDDW